MRGSKTRNSPHRAAALLTWFSEKGRDLPWRSTSDPYSILVSEVMLQQTPVSRVIGHYTRWMARFPSIEALAVAPLDQVLRLWQGLGYPVRARRLRDSARIISADGWPPDTASLTTLPGVGPYTAAAVASMAYGESVAAVDTNVRRVISRWLGEPLDGSLLSREAQNQLTGDAGTWNQAVMELGALVCRPEPKCDICPVSAWCADPTVYVPPPRQDGYEGSDRQIRGAVLRAVVDGGAGTVTELVARLSYPAGRIDKAVGSLIGDGLLESRDGRITGAH